RSDGPALRHEFTYDSTGRVSTATKPEHVAGAARAKATYVYDDANKTTKLQLAGFTPSSGFARRVKYDDSGRITEQTDPSGTLTSTYLWDSKEQLVSQTDPAGLKTTFAYDFAGRRTDSWGPAPASALGADNRPINPAAVAHNLTRFDEGMSGLAAAYWSNPNLGGPASSHTTGLGSTTDLSIDWGSTPPVTPDGNGDWALRLTGELTLASAGDYGFTFKSKGAIRIWIDDKLLVELANDLGSNWEEAAYVSIPNTVADSKRRIRVDYRETTGTAGLQVLWVLPGTYNAIPIPGSALVPSYGLVTSSTDPDGKTTSTEYSDVTAGIGPELGLATATVADPSGLALRTSTGFEAPGTGFLRRTNKTLPAGNSTAYQYYGATSGPIAAVCGVASTHVQAGAIKRVTGADPDGAGPQLSRITEFVHDKTGRPVGRRVGDSSSVGSAGWACTTYNGRGRIKTQTWPAHGSAAARTAIYNYAVGSDPLKASVWDGSSTVEATVDLLGRTLFYKAGQAAAAFTSYDRLSRVTRVVGPVGDQTFTYEPNSGRLDTVALDARVLADAAYDPATGRMSSVAYANGSSMAAQYDTLGRPKAQTFSEPAGARLVGHQVTSRSLAGRVTDELVDVDDPLDLDPPVPTDFNPSGPNMAYDAAGRLITYFGPGGRVDYGFGNSPACSLSPNAGANTNRQTLTTASGSAQDYCYDKADRLVSAPGISASSVTYDDHGNTTALASDSYSFDSADRHTATQSGNSTLVYTRDPLDRLRMRREALLGHTVAEHSYGYADHGDSPDVVMDPAGAIKERFVSLPGWVQLTLRAGVLGTEEIWSYSNLHQDVVAVGGADGKRSQGPFAYSAFGEGETPDNSSTSADFGWVGAAAKLTEHSAAFRPIIEMGARVYDQALGRFLQVDPVEGGSANDYDYALQDPCGNYDMDGRWARKRMVDRVAVAMNEAYERMCGGRSRDIIRAASWIGISLVAGPANSFTSRWFMRLKPAAFKSGAMAILKGASRALFWGGAYATVADLSCRFNENLNG
ncbi:MAG: PA14 domain-containing protein, partial [Actinomycetota bacterium]